MIGVYFCSFLQEYRVFFVYPLLAFYVFKASLPHAPSEPRTPEQLKLLRFHVLCFFSIFFFLKFCLSKIVFVKTITNILRSELNKTDILFNYGFVKEFYIAIFAGQGFGARTRFLRRPGIAMSGDHLAMCFGDPLPRDCT